VLVVLVRLERALLALVALELVAGEPRLPLAAVAVALLAVAVALPAAAAVAVLPAVRFLSVY
jgi:hypothetical protein